MKASEQTIQQIERMLRKISQKFPFTEDPTVLTDIHIRVSPDSGELLAFDDDDEEVTRCVVEQWIDNKEDTFYDDAADILRRVLKRQHELVDSLGILRPFSFVMEDEEKEHLAELYVADGDTVILGGELMKDLDKDLDAFMEKLFED
jgi:hypothetical protein